MMVRMGYKPASEVEAVLTDLCIQYGYCLTPEKAGSIIDNPPGDPASFVEAVLKAEGVPTDSLDSDARKVLTELVDRRLFSA
jgi:hypothetical protein